MIIGLDCKARISLSFHEKLESSKKCNVKMAMSLAAGSSDVESDSSAGGVGGRVSRLREGWRVHEDEVGHIS